MDLLNLILILSLIIFALYFVYRAALWAERDALLRGKSPLFVKCALFLFFPWGLIAWLLFRPAPVDGNPLSPRTFDLNDFRQQ
jgi:hypothetical protein